MRRRMAVVAVMGLLGLILTVHSEARDPQPEWRRPFPIFVSTPAVMQGNWQINISGIFLDEEGATGEKRAVYYLEEGDFSISRCGRSSSYHGSAWLYSDPGLNDKVGEWEISFSISGQDNFSLRLSMGYDEYLCKLLPMPEDTLAGKCVGNTLREGEDSDMIEIIGGDAVMKVLMPHARRAPLSTGRFEP